jgi:putative hemolysin
VITLEGAEEPSLRAGLREVITRYRAPRTVYALWGSNPEGMTIARGTIEEMDGWW